MRYLLLDFKQYRTKLELLNFISSQIEELYHPNYDALIDVLTFIKEPLTIQLKNKSYYTDWDNLNEVLNIIINENKNIIIK